MNNSRIIEQEIIRRRDMRDVFTFTIDPADAKDFDDALSFAVVNDEEPSPTTCDNYLSPITNHLYQIGVHIADVSFFVRPGTTEDDEAYQRGTSVYLVDRVLPMLPERLSNDLCSLCPGEDKLCMSVIFTMNADAEVLKYKICRTVIRSDVRLNYDEAQEIIKATPRQLRDNSETTPRVLPLGGVPLNDALLTLNALALKLRAARLAKGALAIEQDEVRFRLDKNGHPVDIYFEQPNEAHHLIEEFMLLANRTVATAVGSGRPFVYRVHDLPDGDKLEEVEKFRRQYRSRARNNEAFRRAIDLLTIRAQAKAVYSTHNIGHYGLAFSHYTHFTSPIRRYPDLMVHRLVEKYILSAKRSFSETVLQRSGLTAQAVAREELELMCEHCSECEQEAQQAERDSIKLFQAMWMADHLYEDFDGHITGITEFGFFVQLDDTHCEGLIRLELIERPDHYTLGDAVRVKVIRADINRKQIDFEFA